MVDLDKLKDILKRKDFDAFMPILVSDELLELDLDELFFDPDYNILKMMILTLQNYKEELGDEFFDAQETRICYP